MKLTVASWNSECWPAVGWVCCLSYDLSEPFFLCPAWGKRRLDCSVFFFAQEYKRKQLEEQRQSERLQRQLQQEHAYLVSLQQQQQEKKPQLYHYNKNLEPNNKPTWAREVEIIWNIVHCSQTSIHKSKK